MIAPEPSVWWQLAAAVVLGVSGGLILIGGAAVVGIVRADWQARRRSRWRDDV